MEIRFRIDPDEITLNTSFKDDLGIDSLDVFELLLNLEDEYQITLSEEELEKIKTVGDVMGIMEEKGVSPE